MRILVDECLPRKLKHQIQGHEVLTVPEAGWAGTKNGALLRLAAAQYDAFITIDRGVPYQQNLEVLVRGTNLRIVLLAAVSNRLETLLPLVAELLSALNASRPGDVLRVPATVALSPYDHG
jgi:hypothetical protein